MLILFLLLSSLIASATSSDRPISLKSQTKVLSSQTSGNQTAILLSSSRESRYEEDEDSRRVLRYLCENDQEKFDEIFDYAKSLFYSKLADSILDKLFTYVSDHDILIAVIREAVASNIQSTLTAAKAFVPSLASEITSLRDSIDEIVFDEYSSSSYSYFTDKIITLYGTFQLDIDTLIDRSATRLFEKLVNRNNGDTIESIKDQLVELTDNVESLMISNYKKMANEIKLVNEKFVSNLNGILKSVEDLLNLANESEKENAKTILELVREASDTNLFTQVNEEFRDYLKKIAKESHGYFNDFVLKLIFQDVKLLTENSCEDSLLGIRRLLPGKASIKRQQNPQLAKARDKLAAKLAEMKERKSSKPAAAQTRQTITYRTSLSAFEKPNSQKLEKLKAKSPQLKALLNPKGAKAAVVPPQPVTSVSGSKLLKRIKRATCNSATISTKYQAIFGSSFSDAVAHFVIVITYVIDIMEIAIGFFYNEFNTYQYFMPSFAPIAFRYNRDKISRLDDITIYNYANIDIEEWLSDFTTNSFFLLSVSLDNVENFVNGILASCTQLVDGIISGSGDSLNSLINEIEVRNNKLLNNGNISLKRVLKASIRNSNTVTETSRLTILNLVQGSPIPREDIKLLTHQYNEAFDYHKKWMKSMGDMLFDTITKENEKLTKLYLEGLYDFKDEVKTLCSITD